MVCLTFTIFIAVQLTVSCSFAKPRALPKGLAEFLEKVGIPMEDFMRSYQAHRYQARSQATRQHFTVLDESTRAQASSDVPEHSGGVTTNHLNNEPIILPFAYCAPRPATIALPRSYGDRLFPSHVTLNRCSGGCSLQDAAHCAVTKQDVINVQTLEIHDHGYRERNVTVYSHTDCQCDCIKSASDCDPHTQTWNAGSCKCDCAQDGSQCDPNTQNWNSKTCQCECSMAVTICDYNKEWDKVKCGCHCKKSIQDTCEAQNQVIDTATCQCFDDMNAL